MPGEHPELSRLLLGLLDAGVEFVLVGGAAAVAHGAPITIRGVELVHSREPENVARLAEALGAMGTRLRGHNQDGRPTTDLLSAQAQTFLDTTWGRLDVLGALPDGHDYMELQAGAEAVDLEGRPLFIVALEALIQSTAAAGRAEERLMLPTLIALQRRRS